MMAFGSEGPRLAMKCASPEIEIDWSASTAPHSGTYGGQEGLAEFCRSLWDAWGDFTPEIDELLEQGPELLITVHRVRARQDETASRWPREERLSGRYEARRSSRQALSDDGKTP